MSTLFIGSTGPGSGRSLMAWFLAERLADQGLQVGFVKASSDPAVVAIPGKEDHDLALMQHLLGKAAVQDDWGERADVRIVMGSQRIFSDFMGSAVPDTQLVRELQAQICLMDRYENLATSIYSILSIHSLFKGSVRIVVVNRVPSSEVDSVRTRLVPLLHAQGIPAVAVLPEDQVLSSLCLAKICQALSAKVLLGEAHLGRIVGGYTRQAYSLVGPLSIFRKVYGKLVLLALLREEGTPSDYSEEALASVAGILLTSGRLPSHALLEAAGKAEIPLLLTSMDTFGAFDGIQSASSPITKEDRYKQARFSELLRPQITTKVPLCAVFNLTP
jgi:BioD-like phosphotransacetylase family protein